MTEKTSLLPICLKCGAQCCKREGSPMVLPKEREAIINETGKDVFKKEGKYYIIPQNPCPFLDNNNTLTDEFSSDAKREIASLSNEQKEDLNKLNIKDEWNFEEENNNYGQELILDLHGCDIKTFSQENLKKYFVEICNKIDMKRHGEPLFWEDHSEIPHLKGISAIQFIETSNIVVHALNMLGAVYINLFSCKEFDQEKAKIFSKNFFKAEEVVMRNIDRI